MSRTWKDQPLRVQRMKAMQLGHIDHDHAERSPHVWESYWQDRCLSVTFYKWAQAEIHEYKLMLDSLAGAYTYEMVEHGNTYSTEGAFLDRMYSRQVWHPKTVEFVVKKLYRHEPQDLCTDAEHYDALTNTDTRNGKRVRCTPRVKRGRRRLQRYEVSRAAVKEELYRAKASANSDRGLDPDYSSTVLEERWSKKVWIWDD